MWGGSKASFEQWLGRLLHTHDTPRRTALALGLGVAIGFSPLIGMHLPLGILLAFLFNLNRVAVIGGVCSNVPWVMGFYYASATAAGTWLLGREIPARLMTSLKLAWEIPQWTARIDAVAVVLQPLLWPFVLGSTLGCLVLGAAAYSLALPVLIALRRRREHGHDLADDEQSGKSLTSKT